jgi:hypothetical protein
VLLESVLEAGSKVVERHGSIRMARGTECKSSLMELDGLFKVRHDTPLPESVSKAISKTVERRGSIWVTKRQCSSMKLNGFVEV